ncbi:hypothetical protein PODOV061v2_0054 [Vibrio phage 172P1]|nr:hypothetical protein PODOV061v2_0054 [Vibrio phage 172P1]
MIHLMDSGDLCQYFGGTFVALDGEVKYVGEVRSDSSCEFYNNTTDSWMPMENCKPFFPHTCAATIDGMLHVLGTSRASRDYKRSYRGNHNDLALQERMLTKVLNNDWLSFELAVKLCHEKAPERVRWYEAFGHGKFCLKQSPNYSVLIVQYLGNEIGYVFDNSVVVAGTVSPIIVNKLRKELGHERVLFED